MNEYELIGRLADLDKRLRVIEGQPTAAVQPVPQPQPQTLVEAVEELMEAMPKRIDGCCSTILNNAINNFHIASAREKKRQEIYDRLVLIANRHKNKANDLDRVLSALDAYEKGGDE